jgi:hypothetical protein
MSGREAVPEAAVPWWRQTQATELQCRECRRDFTRMLTRFERSLVGTRHRYVPRCGPYCDDCAALHHGLQCRRCGRVACAHAVATCALCGQHVCFFDPHHSVRVAGRTCCLECVRSIDVRPQVVALLDHLPGGVVRGVAGALQRLQRAAPPEPYGSALARTAEQWAVCTVCRQRTPERRTNADCATCGRQSTLIRARCLTCGPWRCRRCRGGAGGGAGGG